MEELLLRVEEAAKVLGVSRSRMYQMVAEGTVPSVRVGRGTVRVPTAALREYVRRLSHDVEGRVKSTSVT